MMFLELPRMEVSERRYLLLLLLTIDRKVFRLLVLIERLFWVKVAQVLWS